jgi:hypothetical protein
MEIRLASISLIASAGLACAGTGSDPTPAPPAGGYEACAEPRPQMCTRDWRPVCGRRDTGVRCVTTPCPSWETRTYGNACTACADPAVHGFRSGECEVEGVAEDG